eukprot:1634166-Amphidinium_carterae.1
MRARVQLLMTPAAKFTCALHHSINVSSVTTMIFLNISAGTNAHDFFLCTKQDNWRNNEQEIYCATD